MFDKKAVSKIDGLTAIERKDQQTQYIESCKDGIVHKTDHTIKSCFFGLFEYVERLAKEDFSLMFVDPKGKIHKHDFKAPKTVVVSENLFRSYSCIDYGCSKCCWNHGFVNFFSEGEFSQFKEKYDKEAWEGYKPMNGFLNGKEYTFYYHEHTSNLCTHLKTGEINGCSVHELNPLHCAYPLIKLNRRGDTVRLTRQEFGRNWQTKCPAEFDAPTPKSYEYAKFLVTRTMNIASEYGIKTFVPEVLEEMEHMWNELQRKAKQKNTLKRFLK